MPNIKNNKRGVLPCEVDGCDNLIFAKDWCKKHYDRNNTHGSPTVVNKRGRKTGSSPTAEQIFWMGATPGYVNECWEWKGAIAKRKDRKGKGYGRFQYNGKSVLAHRFSFKLHSKQNLQPFEPVHHKCGNTLCVNPNHLQKTTPHANTAEMLERNWYKKRISELEAKLAECRCAINT